jgi:predicted enzyme related to lactoylglutathione lyase
VKPSNLVTASLLGLCLATALGAAPLRAAEPPPPLPPLLDQPVDTRLPGKFIWADLFSSDLEVSRDFLVGLLGWEWRWISTEEGRRYGIFYNDGSAVAGLAHHRPKSAPGQRYARWAYYLSVRDVDDLLARAQARGAEVLMPVREVAKRGRFAILADGERAPLGVLTSHSGDPEDYRAEPGEWLWHQLFARDPDAAASYYAELFGYELHAPKDYPDLVDIILASDGFARAGIARLPADSEAISQWLGLVRVADLRATLARVEALGGEVLLAPDAGVADGAVALVADPLGAPLGLVQRDDPQGEGER